MAKTNITLYSSTPSSNTDINSINIDENCPASGLNNAIRELMAHLKNVDTGSQALTSPSFTAMSTDTISEKTSANGVSIDSVTLKDGELGTSASPVPINSSSLNGGQFGGRRNIVIGGCMRVAQRGTSFTLGNASAKYPVDRFFVQDVNSSSGEATVSQSTTAPTDFKNSLKIDVTTADTALVADDQYKIEHRIEGQDIAHLNFGTSSAKIVTLSFYIRSNKTGNTQVGLMNSANNRAYVATFTIDSANTWERKEITIAGDQSGTWLDTNGIGLRLRWGSYGSTYQTSSVNQWVGSNVISRNDSPINFFDSTDNELYITGVQLEVGSVATPFEHRSFGEELASCQRYFQLGGVCTGRTYSDSQAELYYPFQSTMRSAPTISLFGAGNDVSDTTGIAHISGVGNFNLSSLSGGSLTKTGCILSIGTAGGMGGGNIVGIRGTPAQMDAEI